MSSGATMGIELTLAPAALTAGLAGRGGGGSQDTLVLPAANEEAPSCETVAPLPL